MRPVIPLLVITLIGSGCRAPNNPQLTGHFEGYFEYGNKKMNMSINFAWDKGKHTALLSIPDNLQLDKPFTTVTYNAPYIELTMKGGELPVTIGATLHQDNIDGKLKGSLPIGVHLTKVKNYIPPLKPYTKEQVILNNKGRKFSANLYLPVTNLPSPAVIMVAGSGNHTKEEYNGAADLFASRGVATLTFDKRNVTDVPGVRLKQVSSDIASMKDLVSDVETAFYYLKTRKQINQRKIGLMGFSLGAVEVPVVAANHPEIAFVAAISGNATTDKEFIINQGLNKYRENRYDVVTIKKTEALYNELFTWAKTRLNKTALQAELDKAHAEGWGRLCFPREVPGEDELKYLLTWNNFEFDPSGYWKKVNVPCLVIYGEKDKYIPVEHSIEILEKVFRTKKELLTLKLYKNADHTIRTGSGKGDFEFPEYADGYINDVLSWLLKQAAS